MPESTLTAVDVQMIGEILLPLIETTVGKAVTKAQANATLAAEDTEKRIDKKFDEQNEVIEKLSDRIASLESKQNKALLGFGALMAIITLLWNVVWNWIKRKVGIK